MQVELDREDLITLVRGSQPSYKALQSSKLVAQIASYSDQYGKYYWRGLEALDEPELWELYKLIKSYKD